VTLAQLYMLADVDSEIAHRSQQPPAAEGTLADAMQMASMGLMG
jgi:hypothetical protein